MKKIKIAFAVSLCFGMFLCWIFFFYYPSFKTFRMGSIATTRIKYVQIEALLTQLDIQEVNCIFLQRHSHRPVYSLFLTTEPFNQNLFEKVRNEYQWKNCIIENKKVFQQLKIPLNQGSHQKVMLCELFLSYPPTRSVTIYYFDNRLIIEFPVFRTHSYQKKLDTKKSLLKYLDSDIIR